MTFFKTALFIAVALLVLATSIEGQGSHRGRGGRGGSGRSRGGGDRAGPSSGDQRGPGGPRGPHACLIVTDGEIVANGTCRDNDICDTDNAITITYEGEDSLVSFCAPDNRAQLLARPPCEEEGDRTCITVSLGDDQISLPGDAETGLTLEALNGCGRGERTTPAAPVEPPVQP